MNEVPRHAGGRWVAEVYGCDFHRMEDAANVEAAMREAVQRLGARPESIEAVFHKFQPQGLSGSVLSPAALIAIHTWPEDGAATLDLYFYNSSENPEDVLRELANHLGATDTNSVHVSRGSSRHTHAQG
ncbi:MAG TPA: S-adenosylmethionine decarboxylase [Deinococcales bacterium]|nr:S-adenosylmethionine decarboxylase [Deinococcales bacterium]